MIVVDTSALVRIFLRETGYEAYQRAILASPAALVPMSCIIEFSMLRRLGESRIQWLNAVLDRPNVAVAGIDPELRELAVTAALEYGRGSGHRAQLNFGDCIVYAVARFRELPLLFAGEDFRHTDVTPALPVET